EQYRQEVFLRAKDPTAQRRVERLRRRWLTLNAVLIRNAKAEREATRKDLQTLESQRFDLAKSLDQATQTDAALAERQAAIEEQEAVLKTRHALLEDELSKATGGHPDS